MDSSAWLSYFSGDANAKIFSTPIKNSEKLIILALPLADSIIYATGQKFKAELWTQVIDFKSLESVKFYPKKNT